MSDPVASGGRQPPVTLLMPFGQADAEAVPVAEAVAVCEAACDALGEGEAPMDRLCVAVADDDGVGNEEPVGEGVGGGGDADGEGEQAVLMARSRTPRNVLEEAHALPPELATELSA